MSAVTKPRSPRAAYRAGYLVGTAGGACTLAAYPWLRVTATSADRDFAIAEAFLDGALAGSADRGRR